LTTHYDDKILEHTSEWITTNALVRRVIGDKTGIIKGIKELKSLEYLESRKIGNTIQYRRKDGIQTNDNFNKIIKIKQMNQDIEFEAIEKITSLTTKSGKLSKKAKNLLEHIEDQIDMTYIVMTRVKYQEQLGIIQHRMAQKRIVQLESFISKIMNKINTKYSKDIKSIQEYFQNHSKEYRFKV
jgi:hypothetical protein